MRADHDGSHVSIAFGMMTGRRDFGIANAIPGVRAAAVIFLEHHQAFVIRL